VTTLAAAARTVLLPIHDSLELSPWLADYLQHGGRTVLIASSAAEYAARRISDERRAQETPELIRRFTSTATDLANRPVLFAVDAEPTGVQRLEHLLPVLPSRAELPNVTTADLRQLFRSYADEARRLGIGMFLGPVVDEIRGANSWLDGRILADDLETISAIAELYVAEAQQAGIIVTAKHFPGHSHLDAHPADNLVALEISYDEVQRNLDPFRRLIAAGVDAVMVGPVVVDAIDPERPAANSARVIGMLRDELEFRGLVVSDDLDALSTMRTDALDEIAVRSVEAGVELLLIPGGDAVVEVAGALERAVTTGRLPASTLHGAAEKVQALAERSALRVSD
jgi:beta-N-acetylhexosaminidase